MNRIAMVTGASQGIGRACALELARAGNKIVLASRRVEKLEEVAREIRETGAEAFVVALDVASRDSVKQAFQKVTKEFGPVAILVNNAGVTRDSLAMFMKEEAWNFVLQTNLTGAFFCAQQAIPAMMRVGWGRIVNVSTVSAEAGGAGQANYVASKAGLIGLTKTLALELASRNITVNAVAPGFIETAMTSVLKDEQKKRFLEAIPMGRAGQPGDVAAAVRFLAGEEAAYITGSVIDVNGGLYIR